MNMVIESKLTEVMSISVPALNGDTFSNVSLQVLIESLKDKSSVLLGPGIGTHPETIKLVQKLIPHIHQPLVLDADGLNAFEGNWEEFEHKNFPVILTPHPGEMSRMMNMNVENIIADQIRVTTEFSKKHQCLMVLKTARSLIATPDERFYVNVTGNPGMASGGTGDILAGLIAGLTAQKLSPENSLKAGVFLHGLAGDLAAIYHGERELIAGDLLGFLSKARLMVQSEPQRFQGEIIPYPLSVLEEGDII